MYLCHLEPCFYVYAYFDDYVLCFRNWIWAVLLSVVASNQADLRVRRINIEISFQVIILYLRRLLPTLPT